MIAKPSVRRTTNPDGREVLHRSTRLRLSRPQSVQDSRFNSTSILHEQRGHSIIVWAEGKFILSLGRRRCSLPRPWCLSERGFLFEGLWLGDPGLDPKRSQGRPRRPWSRYTDRLELLFRWEVPFNVEPPGDAGRGGYEFLLWRWTGTAAPRSIVCAAQA